MEKSVFVKKPPCIIRHPQHYTENEGESAMTIAILAHDSRKELALQFCTAYSGILSRNTVIATGTTGRMLAQATGLPVSMWDERRTTVEAHNILSQHNYHGKKRKDTVDAVAASLILEGYLTYKKRNG